VSDGAPRLKQGKRKAKVNRKKRPRKREKQEKDCRYLLCFGLASAGVFLLRMKRSEKKRTKRTTKTNWSNEAVIAEWWPERTW
jgi:hypothetical protein